MSTSRSLLIIVTLLLCFTADAQKQFRIVGYYSLWRASSQKDRLPLKKLTHLNLWFLNPDSLGNFAKRPDDLKKFIAKVHRKNVQVLFSIGGGSPQPQYHKLLLKENR